MSSDSAILVEFANEVHRWAKNSGKTSVELAGLIEFIAKIPVSPSWVKRVRSGRLLRGSGPDGLDSRYRALTLLVGGPHKAQAWEAALVQHWSSRASRRDSLVYDSDPLGVAASMLDFSQGSHQLHYEELAEHLKGVSCSSLNPI